MNVKFRMPRLGKKPNEQRGWVKELLMTFLATTISIVLTFGTAMLIENHQRNKAKRQMAMMIIHDIDESIVQMEEVDSILRRFSALQLNVLEGTYDQPIMFANVAMSACDPSKVEFPETAEKIFTSNIDTWSTIGKTDFIDNVTWCYIERRKFKTQVIDEFSSQLIPGGTMKQVLSLDSLLEIDPDVYVGMAGGAIHQMKEANRLNMKIMGITDKDMEKFLSNKLKLDQSADDETDERLGNEYMEMALRKDSARTVFMKKKDIMYPKQGNNVLLTDTN